MNEPERPVGEGTRPTPGLTNRQAYNLVSDVAGGVNVRLRDNVMQGIVIAVCLVLGVVLGALLGSDHALGAIIGGFSGLLAGLFGSGIFLMIFRAVMHLRGCHD